ncbi:ribosome biogenesis GTPase Der [Niveispirillum sp.]|uniref:ribosome biogenesis GTPase Der n=1 Tax=Niveispirillum sp. TaxID=1917217 RepID=UPI001B3E5194|nr:ribosome biogenesis GTPase Der [Niveispirillum sp.]MBP7336630.1 ribosome biogenesis GTPase Der [Niveispirillum sp.]
MIKATHRLTVAIIGRPNVGKSTLFNRLVGKKIALVDDQPGVTRDWRAADGRVGGLEFTVVDTAGLEDVFDDSLEARMRRQTERAVERADVALFLIDARAGVTAMDKHFGAWLRKAGKPTILIANKCEGAASRPGLIEAFELGLGEPVPLSAEHGEGMADLVHALEPFMPKDEPEEDEEAFDADAAEAQVREGEPAEEDEPKALQLAIVGRPNVGKSTLLNALVQEERVLTGPEAGMTRDAIAVEWEWKGRPIRLVDTAGLRKRARVEAKLEKMANQDTLRVIRMAHVVVLLLDADGILDKQDLTIARLVIEEGRALVIALNKWDAVEDKNAALRRMADRLQTSLPQVKGIPTVAISALKGQKLTDLLDAVVTTYGVWNRRIPTSQLNRWLADMTDSHPPPLVDGRRLKIRYMTQVKSRPPTFALFVSKPVDLPEHYSRYLVNGMREHLDLPGVPIRLLLRKGSTNPFD